MESIIDATYVINMDADAERLKEFDNMMSASDWKYTRHPAINGKKLLSKWNDAKGSEEYEKLEELSKMRKKYVRSLTWLTASEIGCLLSHVLLWEQVANDPTKNRIAIFEDDARTYLEGNTVKQLIIDLYGHLSSNNIPEPDILYLGKALDNCLSYKKIWNNVYESHHPLCLHAYILTKRGAQEMLKMAPYFLAIDMIPIKAIEKKIITAFTFHPSIYFQDVFNNVSNLRNLGSALNNTTECLVAQQYIAGDTWSYVFIIIIGVIAATILFVIFIWMTHY